MDNNIEHTRDIADGSELLEILFNLTPDSVSNKNVLEVMKALPGAIAQWLKTSEPVTEGEYFGQFKTGFVFRLNYVPQSEGKGDAEGTIEKEHYRLHVKAGKVLLRELEGAFGLEVKNG